MLREAIILIVLLALISLVYTFNSGSEAMTSEVANQKVHFNRRVKVRGFRKSTRELLGDTSKSL